MSINLETINPGDNPNDGRVKINKNFTAITASLGDPLFSTLSATTISASTIYSGSTNLYNIFLTAADGNDITRIQPGLNTYTGGTGNAPTINISAATLNSLNVSSNSILSALTATTAYLIGTDFGAGTSVLKTTNSTGGTTFEIFNSGFIKITDPTYNFELKPNGASTLTELNTSNLGYQLTSSQGYLRVNRTTSGPFLLYPNSNVTRVDLTGDVAGTPLLSMTTIANGFNVGINNTTPVEKLDVNGNVNISSGLTANTIYATIYSGLVQVYRIEKILTQAELLTLNSIPVYVTTAELGLTATQAAKFHQLNTEWWIYPDGVAFTQTGSTAIVLKTNLGATAITHLPMGEVIGTPTAFTVQSNGISAAYGSASVITVRENDGFYFEATGGSVFDGGPGAYIKAVLFYEKIDF